VGVLGRKDDEEGGGQGQGRDQVMPVNLDGGGRIVQEHTCSCAHAPAPESLNCPTGQATGVAFQDPRGQA
jgi:hypothetical protein